MLSKTLKLNLIFQNYSHSSLTLSSKNHLKNKEKNKCVCIYEIIWLIIMKIKTKIKNRSHRYNINRPRGLFIWDETFHMGGRSYLSKILFIWGLHVNNVPPEWRYFSSHLACVSAFKYVCYFHCLLKFCYFNFELLITSTLLNSIRWTVIFYRMIIKTQWSQTK